MRKLKIMAVSLLLLTAMFATASSEKSSASLFKIDSQIRCSFGSGISAEHAMNQEIATIVMNGGIVTGNSVYNIGSALPGSTGGESGSGWCYRINFTMPNPHN